MNKFTKPVLCLLLGISHTAFATELIGKSTFSGSVSTSTCSIYLPQQNQVIDFGNLPAATLAAERFIKKDFFIQTDNCYLNVVGHETAKIKFQGAYFDDKYFRMNNEKDGLKLSILYNDTLLIPNKYNALSPIVERPVNDRHLLSERYYFTLIVEADNHALSQVGNYNAFLTFNISYE